MCENTAKDKAANNAIPFMPPAAPVPPVVNINQYPSQPAQADNPKWHTEHLITSDSR